MIVQRVPLAREALEKALEIREQCGFEFGTPVNVFDLCDYVKPKVRLLFVDYSMEGCYLRSDRPLIQVSALRPLARRVFNCAHELGHHVFGHGSTIDELQEEGRSDPYADPQEFLVNTFAGFLLMPKLGVRRAFSLRGWRLPQTQPEQLYVVACHFGVGYETLVSHLAYGLREISPERAKQLRRIRLPSIRHTILGSHVADRLFVADQHYSLPNLDTEVGTYLLLPPGCAAERDDLLTVISDLPTGRLFRADRPGLVRVEAGEEWAIVVRVSRYQYAGWSKYRHLAQDDRDDE